MPFPKIPDECRPGRHCFECTLPPDSCPGTGSKKYEPEELEMFECGGLASVSIKRATAKRRQNMRKSDVNV